MRRFLAIIAGLVVGYLVINGIQFIGHSVYPPPEGVAEMDLEELTVVLTEYIKTAPVGAFIFLILSHTVGTFIGVMVSMAISKGYKIAGSIVGGLFTILTILLIFMLPHPLWFSILDIALVMLAAILGLRVIQPKNA